MLGRQLDVLDFGRRLAGVRTRLVGADARLGGAIDRHRHRTSNRLAECASRLEALSPLSVLGRGYAVCWDHSRTKVLHDSRDVSLGSKVRVTLARGELECDVRSTTD
jgi:exodeoxyribonuclease VII large subunit